MAARTPREVIDQAVAENKLGEYVLYGMATLFACVGSFLLIWAAITRSGWTGLAGAASDALIIPAMIVARKTRKESVAIRLLEAPLSIAETATEAAYMLSNVYSSLMLEPLVAPAPPQRGKQGKGTASSK